MYSIRKTGRAEMLPRKWKDPLCLSLGGGGKIIYNIYKRNRILDLTPKLSTEIGSGTYRASEDIDNIIQ